MHSPPETKAQRKKCWQTLVSQHREALDRADSHRKAGRHGLADRLLDTCRKIQADIDKMVCEDNQLAGA